MPYISHGYWVGQGEPTQPQPPRARCGGPGLCSACSHEAGAIGTQGGPRRRRYATHDELVQLLARYVRRIAPRVAEPIAATEAVLAGLRNHGVDVDALVETTVAEPEVVVQHGRALAERLAVNQPRIALH